MKKIEERKRKLEEKDEANDQENQSTEDQPVKIKRKRKKKKIVEEVIEDDKPPANFVVLGKDDHSGKKKAKRVLPHWLQSASVVSVDLQNLVHTIEAIPELDADLITALKENKITHFFPGEFFLF